MPNENIKNLQWMTFDDNGLTVLSKPQIMEQLNTVDQLSFGANFNNTGNASGSFMGTSWYTHNELIAQALASIGSAVKKLYDGSNIMSATGRNLDNRVISAGITRKEKEDGTMESDAELRNRYLLAVSTPAVGTRDALIARLIGATFTNNPNNDPSIITVNESIKEVSIYENDGGDILTGSSVNAGSISEFEAHSILVSIYGLDEAKDGNNGFSPIDKSINIENMNSNNDVNRYIAKVIQNYKTLGCGTAGNISVGIDDGIANKVVRFSYVTEIPVNIEISFDYNAQLLTDDMVTTVFNSISEELSKFINEFTIDKDIVYNDILSVAQKVIINKGYKNNDLSIRDIIITSNGSTIKTVGSNIAIKSDQIARAGSITQAGLL